MGPRMQPSVQCSTLFNRQRCTQFLVAINKHTWAPGCCVSCSPLRSLPLLSGSPLGTRLLRIRFAVALLAVALGFTLALRVVRDGRCVSSSPMGTWLLRIRFAVALLAVALGFTLTLRVFRVGAVRYSMLGPLYIWLYTCSS